MTNENELINILMHMFSGLSLKDNNNSLLFFLCFRNSRSFFYFTAFFQELFVCRGIRIRQSRSFCFWNPKSCATESRIQLKESGIPITAVFPPKRSGFTRAHFLELKKYLVLEVILVLVPKSGVGVGTIELF